MSELNAPPTKKKKKSRKVNTGGRQWSAGGTPDEYQNWSQKAVKNLQDPSLKTMSEADLLKPAPAFRNFRYTGDLRSHHVTPQFSYPDETLKPDYARPFADGRPADGRPISELEATSKIPVLEGDDLATMREACRLGREVLDLAARYLKPGATGDEIDRVVNQACLDRQIYPSPLNYMLFPKSLCVSPNEVICHGIPNCAPFKEGDIVNLDISIYHQGFHSDLNETYFIGAPDEDSLKLVETAYNALKAAAQMIRPKTLYRDLGTAIQSVAQANGCSVVVAYCGHGIGRDFHGEPKVPHYRKNKAKGLMQPGHVFTVEPMLNWGGNSGDALWPDDWTAITKDGQRSSQFEHTFLVTETGYEILTPIAGTDPFQMPDFNPLWFNR